MDVSISKSQNSEFQLLVQKLERRPVLFFPLLPLTGRTKTGRKTTFRAHLDYICVKLHLCSSKTVFHETAKHGETVYFASLSALVKRGFVCFVFAVFLSVPKFASHKMRFFRTSENGFSEKSVATGRGKMGIRENGFFGSF